MEVHVDCECELEIDVECECGKWLPIKKKRSPRGEIKVIVARCERCKKENYEAGEADAKQKRL